jgi:hypothetical protein
MYRVVRNKLHLLLYFNVHDRVGAVDFLDWFLPRSVGFARYKSVRDCVSDPFAFVTWVVRSGALLEAFRELDCSVLAPSFYEILEYSAFFNRVAHLCLWVAFVCPMVGAELAFVCPIYVCGSLANGKHQSAFQGQVGTVADCLNVASSVFASLTMTITCLSLSGVCLSGVPERGSLASSLSSLKL